MDEDNGTVFGAATIPRKESPAKRTPGLLPCSSMRVGRRRDAVSNLPSYNKIVNITNSCFNTYLRTWRWYVSFPSPLTWRDENLREDEAIDKVDESEVDKDEGENDGLKDEIAFGAVAPTGKESPAKRTPDLLPCSSMRVGRRRDAVSNLPSYNKCCNITNFCIKTCLRMWRWYGCGLRLLTWQDEDLSEAEMTIEVKRDNVDYEQIFNPTSKSSLQDPYPGPELEARALTSAEGCPGIPANVSYSAMSLVVKIRTNLNFYLPAIMTRSVEIKRRTRSRTRRGCWPRGQSTPRPASIRRMRSGTTTTRSRRIGKI